MHGVLSCCACQIAQDHSPSTIAWARDSGLGQALHLSGDLGFFMQEERESIMLKYLKEDRYYGDLYDLSTIKECLRICEFWENRMKDLKDDEISIGRVGLDLELYMGKDERYQRKGEVLEGWMDLDRKRDEKMEREKIRRGFDVLSVIRG